MAARILPACRECGKPVKNPRAKTCSLACRDATPKPRPWLRTVEPAIVASGLSVDEWLAQYYWPDGCNLSTAATLLGVPKRSLWAFLRTSGRDTKPQSPAQTGALNPFSGNSHVPTSRAMIGEASRGRQAALARRATGQFGDGPDVRGPEHPSYVNGIGRYREQAFAIYGRACTVCGKTGEGRQIDVHHRDEDRSNNSIDNLAVLCRGCHIRLHRRKGQPDDSLH